MATRVFMDDFSSYSLGPMPFTKWRQDGGFRVAPVIVTTAADGGAAPVYGTKMARFNQDGTVPLSDANNFSNCYLSSAEVPYTNEVFYRCVCRVDANHERTTNSPRKWMRIFQQPTNLDMFGLVSDNAGMHNANVGAVWETSTYWGGSTGDNAASTTGWHTVEWYFNAATGVARVWHDSVRVRDDTDPLKFSGNRWLDFFMSSNWGGGQPQDAHDAINYMYVDRFEVFSDSATGTAATGLMSDASIAVPTVALVAPVNEYFRPR